jgi:diphthine synthase
MLTFVGMGLYDERSITIEGKEAIQTAERVFGEFYTSQLMGIDRQRLEYFHGQDFEIFDRETVEGDPEEILEAAEDGDAVFVTGGDPMMATTHVDLRMRAEDRGIRTRVVHGTTAATAAASLTGLQNYRFGKATTLPFPAAHGGGQVPDSVVDTIEDNGERGLHTLVYLDIKVDDPRWEREVPSEYGERGTSKRASGNDQRERHASSEEEYLTADRAAGLLEGAAGDRLGVVVARAGSANPVVEADHLSELALEDFGRPLHLLVIPGELHDLEREALVSLAGAPLEG